MSPSIRQLSAVMVIGIGAAVQAGPQSHGKLGTWFYNNKSSAVEEDEGLELEQPGDKAKLASHLKGSIVNPAIIFGKYKSVQVNVDSAGRDIIGDAANEPSIALDPVNKARISVGWRQFDNVASNFRQAGNGRTLDGGLTWVSNTVLTPGTFRSDPVLCVDTTGQFFYNSLQQTFFTDVFRSLTGGSVWNFIAPATGGDKQWMIVDNSSSAGKGNLYQSWSTAGYNWGGRQFSRSINGGQTWLDPINIPGAPVWGTLDTSRTGDLYLAGLGDTSFVFCRSVNAKDRTKTPSFDLSVPVDMGGAIVYASD
ncbi:MAG: hypothetical protein ABUL49_01940, partial [bacterium]